MTSDAALRPFEIERPLRPNGCDIDLAGIVSSIVYVRWLEDMRMQIVDGYHPLERQLEQGCGPIIVETRIQYRRPLTIRDRTVGRMWMKELGRMRWTLLAEVLVDGELAASAEHVGAFVSCTTHRPVHMPDEVRDTWQRMTEAAT